MTNIVRMIGSREGDRRTFAAALERRAIKRQRVSHGVPQKRTRRPSRRQRKEELRGPRHDWRRLRDLTRQEAGSGSKKKEQNGGLQTRRGLVVQVHVQRRTVPGEH